MKHINQNSSDNYIFRALYLQTKPQPEIFSSNVFTQIMNNYIGTPPCGHFVITASIFIFDKTIIHFFIRKPR